MLATAIAAGCAYAAAPTDPVAPPAAAAPPADQPLAPAAATVPAVDPAPQIAPTVSNGLGLPAKTIVEIEITDAISSSTAKIGDTFAIRLAEPVRIGGQLMLPIGTVGRGEVTHAAKARWGGKAGELIVMVRYLQCGDQQIPLGHFHFGASGESHLGAAFGASMVIPFAGLLISGDEMLIQPGTRGNAQIARDVSLPADVAQLCAKTQNL